MKKITFETGFKYPFKRPKGLWNGLWLFVPIVGWFALGGYSVRIVKEFIKGKFKELPVFEFKSDLELGFVMFVKSLPLMILYFVVIGILENISYDLADLADLFLAIFVLPILLVNFFNKETVESSLDFKVVKVVFDNIEDYLMVLLKTFLLTLVFLFMSLILVGIPAMIFTQDIFLADFYRRKVKG